MTLITKEDIETMEEGEVYYMEVGSGKLPPSIIFRFQSENEDCWLNHNIEVYSALYSNNCSYFETTIYTGNKTNLRKANILEIILLEKIEEDYFLTNNTLISEEEFKTIESLNLFEQSIGSSFSPRNVSMVDEILVGI